MHGKITRIAAGLALLLAVSTRGYAAEKATGTIVVVTEETADVKGADGKMYKIKVADIVAEDLKTGDIVEYDIVEGAPVHVAKKKAK